MSASRTLRTEAPNPPRNDLKAWFAGEGQVALDGLGDAFEEISAAGTSTDISGMRVACRHLVAAVSYARTTRPVPDAEVDRHFTNALEEYDQAASLCLQGVDQLDADLLSQASAHMTAGSEEVGLATAAVAGG